MKFSKIQSKCVVIAQDAFFLNFQLFTLHFESISCWVWRLQSICTTFF